MAEPSFEIRWTTSFRRKHMLRVYTQQQYNDLIKFLLYEKRVKKIEVENLRNGAIHYVQFAHYGEMD